MAYEYEELILHDVKPLTNPGPPFRHEAMKELQEVYRKAKAWEEFKEEKIKRYMGLRTLIMKGYGDALDTYYLGVFSDELKQMDRLDNTNEFSNLLNDMGDE